MSERQELYAKTTNLMKRYRAERLALAILEKSPMLTMIGSADSPVFTWVSKSWCDYLGWTFDELTSRSFVYFLHPDDAEESINVFRKFQHGNGMRVGFKGDTFTNRYLAKDGSYKRIEWMKLVEFDGNEYIMFANGID